MIEKFRKKPVEVEAVQYTGSTESYVEIRNWVMENWPDCSLDRDSNSMSVFTPTNICMTVHIKDWFVKGIDGSLYPVKEKTFEKTYEKLSFDGLPVIGW